MNNKDNTTLELAALINDSFSNKVALFNENAAKYTDQAVREAFYEILGDDKLTWRNWRAHKTECFEVMETVLNVNLPLAWNNSSFYEQFVETRNGALGDTNEFVVDNDDILFASRFAGNYWSVNRQKLQGKSAFGLQTEWITIRVYDELERFLKGNVTLAEMITKLQKGFQNEIDSFLFLKV